MVIMVFMVTIHTNIMLRSTFMKPMIMKRKINLLIIIIFINGCSLSPGMHMNARSNWNDDSQYVSIDSIEKPIRLMRISEIQDSTYENVYQYKIGVGDQIAVTVWGLPEIFL